MILVTLIYSIVILTLIWARFSFFQVHTNPQRLAARIYDALVLVQILVTYKTLIHGEPQGILPLICMITFYLAVFFLFILLTKYIGPLDFAFSNKVGNIITNGPFQIVRHPFYTTYIVFWATSTIFLNSVILWISFFALLSFYFKSAKNEEHLILSSSYAQQYESMMQNVGMFFPRAKQWRGWYFAILKRKMK